MPGKVVLASAVRTARIARGPWKPTLIFAGPFSTLTLASLDNTIEQADSTQPSLSPDKERLELCCLEWTQGL